MVKNIWILSFLDLICLQLSYVLAYAGSGYGFNLYGTMIYRNMAVFLELADLVVIFIYGTMKNVIEETALSRTAGSQ